MIKINGCRLHPPKVITLSTRRITRMLQVSRSSPALVYMVSLTSGMVLTKIIFCTNQCTLVTQHRPLGLLSIQYNFTITQAHFILSCNRARTPVIRCPLSRQLTTATRHNHITTKNRGPFTHQLRTVRLNIYQLILCRHNIRQKINITC